MTLSYDKIYNGCEGGINMDKKKIEEMEKLQDKQKKGKLNVVENSRLHDLEIEKQENSIGELE